MNSFLKHKRNFAWIFLAGYVLLFTYSAFHFHKIDINNIYHFYEQGSTASSGSINDQVLSSFFTCQFNLVYNSSFLPDTYSFNISGIKKSKEYIRLYDDDEINPSQLCLLNFLRAPPILS